MRDTAIFFPYIDVPRGEWLSRVLLYWDTLWSIVPYEYIHAPKQHSAEMRELLTSGLVVPCIPSLYLGDIPRFADSFLSHVERRNLRPKYIRNMAAEQPRQRIHIEKLGDIGERLVELGLAIRSDYPWFELEPWVARSFMSYLAAVLGKQPGVNAAPVTHERQSFSLLAGNRRLSVQRRDQARDVLLRGVFPRPRLPITLESLVSFKERHGAELRRLRRAIEEECIRIADIDDDRHRRELAAVAAIRLGEEVGAVAEAMQIKWGKVVTGGLLSVVGASGGVISVEQGRTGLAIAAGSGLAAAVYTALEPFWDRFQARREPLAYAAWIRQQFDS